jgi:hypothetical protein
METNSNNLLIELDSEISSSSSMVATFELVLLLGIFEKYSGEELFIKLINFKTRLECYCTMMGTSKKNLEDTQMLLKIIQFIGKMLG